MMFRRPIGMSGIALTMLGLYEIPIIPVREEDKKTLVKNKAQGAKDVGVEKPAGKK